MFPSFKVIVFTSFMALWVSRATSVEKPNICSVVQGLPGLNGRDGRDGVTGLKGDPGPSGQTGAQGARGSIGPPGKLGPPGQKGNQGDKGINGIQGLKGEKGSAGNAGIPGSNGAAGKNGSPGNPGVQGTAGAMGPKGEPGVKGEKGSAGSNGIPGAKGANGVPGSAGIRGSPGAKGEKGVPDTSMTINVAKLEKTLAALETRLASLQKVCYFQAGVTISGKKTYVRNGLEGDYDTAKAACEKMQGMLPSPLNSDENTAIFQIAKSLNKRLFLGINDIKEEGNFVYLNGNKIVYRNWLQKQPDGGRRENCAEMTEVGQWNDRTCANKNIIVCEFNS